MEKSFEQLWEEKFSHLSNDEKAKITSCIFGVLQAKFDSLGYDSLTKEEIYNLLQDVHKYIKDEVKA